MDRLLTCQQCGESIEQRPGRQPIYCSTACRVRAHRGQTGPADPDRLHYAWKHAGRGGAGWCSVCDKFHAAHDHQ